MKGRSLNTKILTIPASGSDLLVLLRTSWTIREKHLYLTLLEISSNESLIPNFQCQMLLYWSTWETIKFNSPWNFSLWTHLSCSHWEQAQQYKIVMGALLTLPKTKCIPTRVDRPNAWFLHHVLISFYSMEKIGGFFKGDLGDEYERQMSVSVLE